MEIIYKSSLIKVLTGGLLVVGVGIVLFAINWLVYSFGEYALGHLIFYVLLALLGFVDLIFGILILVFIYRMSVNHKFYLLLNTQEFRYVHSASKIRSVDWKEMESLSYKKAKIGYAVHIHFKADPEYPDNPTEIAVPISTYQERPEIIFDEMQRYLKTYGRSTH